MRGGAASIFFGYRVMLRRRQCTMKNIARHVVNNARPLLIALPRYGNMPGNEDAAALSRGTVREEP
jgi:hypothetical protein